MSRNTNTDIWIAGAFAAFSVDVLVYPLDTLKTRMQSPDYKSRYLGDGLSPYKSKLLFRGLYQGVGSVILATLPASGAFFATYEGIKSLAESHGFHNILPSSMIHAAASGTAELISCAILTPAEVLKQNAQMVTRFSSSSLSATTQTLQRFRNCPLALWQGYGALAGRNLPFTALQFPLFELFKRKGLSMRTTRQDEIASKATKILQHVEVTSIAAGLSGAVAAVITTPIDVIKTRIMLAAAKENPKVAQIQAADSSHVFRALDTTRRTATQHASHTKSWRIWNTGQEILQTEGFQGLMRGGILRAAWTMLGSGLYLGIYEGGRIWLQGDEQRGFFSSPE